MKYEAMEIIMGAYAFMLDVGVECRTYAVHPFFGLFGV